MAVTECSMCGTPTICHEHRPCCAAWHTCPLVLGPSNTTLGHWLRLAICRLRALAWMVSYSGRSLRYPHSSTMLPSPSRDQPPAPAWTMPRIQSSLVRALPLLLWSLAQSPSWPSTFCSRPLCTLLAPSDSQRQRLAGSASMWLTVPWRPQPAMARIMAATGGGQCHAG